jgi:hypothetical protein
MACDLTSWPPVPWRQFAAICGLLAAMTALAGAGPATQPTTRTADERLAAALERARNGTAVEKYRAVGELRDLDDPRALPVLRELAADPRGFDDRSISTEYGNEAVSTIRYIEGGVLLRQYVKDFADRPAAIAGCLRVFQDHPELGGPGGAAAGRALVWLLGLPPEPDVLRALCRAAYWPGSSRRLEALGEQAAPFLREEIVSPRAESVAACITLLGKLQHEQDMPLFALLMINDGDPSNQSNVGIDIDAAATLALARYGDKALPLLRPMLLGLRHERAVRRAVNCASLIGSEQAKSLLQEARDWHSAKPKPNEATLQALGVWR